MKQNRCGWNLPLFKEMNNLETIEALTTLAKIYIKEGKQDKAKPLLEQALTLSRLELDNPATLLTALDNLSRLYCKLHLYDLAIPLIEESQSLNLPSCLSVEYLADTYASAGLNSKARELWLTSLTSPQALIPNYVLARIILKLANSYETEQDQVNEEIYRVQLIELGRTADFLFKREYLIDALEKLSTLYESQARYSEAEDLVLEMSNLLGNPTSLLDDLAKLSALYESQARYYDAEDLALNMTKLNNYTKAQRHLADLKHKQGKSEEAITILTDLLETHYALKS
jgi:tetratricopeptide (TPR) repeat protein